MFGHVRALFIIGKPMLFVEVCLVKNLDLCFAQAERAVDCRATSALRGDPRWSADDDAPIVLLDEAMQQVCLADAGTAEKTYFTALGIGADKVDYLDTCFKYFG